MQEECPGKECIREDWCGEGRGEGDRQRGVSDSGMCVVPWEGESEGKREGKCGIRGVSG